MEGSRRHLSPTTFALLPDFAIVRLTRPVDAKRSPLQLSLSPLGIDREPCWGAGHPLGSFMKYATGSTISPGSVYRTAIANYYQCFQQTVYGGNSGGPVFNYQHLVCGITTSTLKTDEDFYVDGNDPSTIHPRMYEFGDNAVPGGAIALGKSITLMQRVDQIAWLLRQETQVAVYVKFRKLATPGHTRPCTITISLVRNEDDDADQELFLGHRTDANIEDHVLSFCRPRQILPYKPLEYRYMRIVVSPIDNDRYVASTRILQSFRLAFGELSDGEQNTSRYEYWYGYNADDGENQDPELFITSSTLGIPTHIRLKKEHSNPYWTTDSHPRGNLSRPRKYPPIQQGYTRG